mgnify:FL=1
MGRRSALKAYQNVEVESNAAYADGVQLVQMLFDGLMESIDKAHGHIERGEITEKNETISRAQKIIFGLQMSLDMERGGDLSRNLNDLYEYSVRRLLHAHSRNDVEALEEIKSLITEVSSAWSMLPGLLKNERVAAA